MHIVFVTGSYPSPSHPSAGAFVRQFVLAVARLGHLCTVVCPTSVLQLRHGRLPRKEEIETHDGSQIRVIRPRFISFSSRGVRVFNTAILTQTAFNRAVLATVGHLDRAPDVVYGHFLYQAGYAAVVAAEKVGVPSILGVGEGTFWTVEPMGYRRARRDFARASGALAVSSMIRDGLIHDIGMPPEKIRMIPNGVDLSLFYKRDRGEMCRKHSIPESTFNISFVGTFDNLKGPARLLTATTTLENVSLILIGNGDVKLKSEQIVFKGAIPHQVVPEYLAASDLFVLPTMEEGSCNALIEAMACGIPIVTSNGTYNDDIVDEEVSLRIDPRNVHQIRNAIMQLMSDPDRRKTMSKACLQKARAFDIDLRAKTVMEWIEETRKGTNAAA